MIGARHLLLCKKEIFTNPKHRVLAIKGQFLYLPGCMIISFDDEETHTTEVKIVRSVQGVDLGKLRDVHEIYKLVVHDLISVDEAMSRLDSVVTTKPKFNKWYVRFNYPSSHIQWGLRPLPCHVSLSLWAVCLSTLGLSSLCFWVFSFGVTLWVVLSWNGRLRVSFLGTASLGVPRPGRPRLAARPLPPSRACLSWQLLTMIE